MGVPATLSSVPDVSPYIQYIASGGQTVYPYPFPITEDSDLVVVINGVTQATDSTYSVSGVGNATGGNVTLSTGSTVDDIITLYRDIPIERISQIAQNSGFSSTVFNNEFNNFYLIAQQLQAAVAQCLQIPNTNSPSPVTTLTPAAYALRALMFDQYGNPTPGVLTATALTQALFNSFLATSSVPLGVNDADNVQQLLASLSAGTAQTIWCEGDSTMYGNSQGGGTQVTFPPPVVLQNTVNTYLGNSSLTVVNNAVGGTSLNDMLTGVNGYTQTFAARIAVSGAQVVFCNHGLNDAYGHTGTTTPLKYRQNLITFIQLCRQYGKTPVLVTTHPIVSTGSFGSVAGFAAAPAWTIAAGQFSEIMREVAIQHGVILVDQYKWLTLTMGTDNSISGVNQNEPLTMFPDGAHGSQATYFQTGLNLCDAILGAGVETFVSDMQVIGASRSNASAKTLSLSPTVTSRYGASFADTNASAVLKILFRVGVPGIDLSILHPLLNTLSTNIGVQLDGGGLSGLSQGSSSWSSSNFLQDYETQLLRNVSPGFHQLVLTPTDGRPIAFNALRARTNTRDIVTNGGSSTIFSRELLAPSLSLQGSSANAVAVYNNLVLPFYVESCQLEWTATMLKSSGVGVGGYYGTTVVAAGAQQTVIVGLNSSGFLTVWEATAPGSYTATVLDSTDHSGGSHLYAFLIGVGTIQCFIDGSAVGGSTALTQGYAGGNICLWRGGSSGNMQINNLQRVWTN